MSNKKVIQNNSENTPLLQSHILTAIHKIRKSKNRVDVKVITKKINKTSGTNFVIITNVKTLQYLVFFAFPLQILLPKII